MPCGSAGLNDRDPASVLAALNRCHFSLRAAKHQRVDSLYKISETGEKTVEIGHIRTKAGHDTSLVHVDG